MKEFMWEMLGSLVLARYTLAISLLPPLCFRCRFVTLIIFTFVIPEVLGDIVRQEKREKGIFVEHLLPAKPFASRTIL